jgi:hypothetical protein
MRFDPDKVRQFEYAGWERAVPIAAISALGTKG